MTIAAAIFLIAVGAILRYATNFGVSGVSIDTVGLILMIAGVVGLILSFIQEFIWTDRERVRRGAPRAEEVPAPAEERVRREERLPPRY
jgi:hypothetical protein